MQIPTAINKSFRIGFFWLFWLKAAGGLVVRVVDYLMNIGIFMYWCGVMVMDFLVVSMFIVLFFTGLFFFGKFLFWWAGWL